MEELAAWLIFEYYKNEIGRLHTETFEDDLIDNVASLMSEQMGEPVDRDMVIRELDVFRLYAPCRTSLRALPQQDVDEALARLDVPQLVQRSPEWYAFRQGLITASAIYKAIGTPAKQNELIVEKCCPSIHTMTMEGARHWGVKYEPVSLAYYEHTYATKVKEFGCVRHPTIPFLGASPDGINIGGHLHGRMLEIKNPVSREITGTPKEDYWIQVQVQEEVCGLNACDFLETKFVEYASRAEFDADGTFQTSACDTPKGIILCLCKDGHSCYEYAPFGCTEEEFNEWEVRVSAGHEWVASFYWKLEDVCCTLIERNQDWFAATLPRFADIWKIIETEIVTGEWTSRRPLKRASVKILV